MTTLSNTFKVAIYEQFLESFARIPRAQQKKVHQFIRKFRQNPASDAINYEKIHEFKDPNLRTVRIDAAWRAVVLRPAKGNVFVLLWVDHHDEAIAWGRNKRVEVNPEIGGLQVYTVEGMAPPPANPVEKAAGAPQPGATSGLFADRAPADLMRIGVPEALVPIVRRVESAEELKALAAALPAEAFEALGFLLEGEPLEDVIEAVGLGTAPKEKVKDIDAALETDVSKRSFVMVEDDDTLEAMLNAPLEKWRVFLHPSQRKLVERDWSGPVRVLGGAGTGKTVVGMHRARWLMRSRFAGTEDRLLFTTFTRNLAADIAANLGRICSPDEIRRIEVVHLDKWTVDFLHRNGYAYRIAYWTPGSGELWKAWKSALEEAAGDHPESFYREEWDHVVQPQGCTTLESYLTARRAGRGVPLTRRTRGAVWRVFERYLLMLEEAGLRESEDAMRDAAMLLESGKASTPYRAVVVDESQDMSTVAFRLLRAMIPEERQNDLFIVGDGHQRIYRRKVVLSHAGVRVVGRSRRLKVNYRTTDEIRRLAVGVLAGLNVEDLDGGLDSLEGYRSLMFGEEPLLVHATDLEAEVSAIAGFLKAEALEDTCLVARTTGMLDKYAAALESRGVQVHPLRLSAADDRATKGLRVATMHRVKGLEFERMVIAGANEGLIPLSVAVNGTQDEAVREELERQERALLYVALTRARRAVLVTASGKPTPWLPWPPG